MQPVTGLGTVGAGRAEGSTDPRLGPAAHAFEACLMKEFLKPLQKDALFDDGKGGVSSDGSDNALMSFGSESLARAISDREASGLPPGLPSNCRGSRVPAGKPRSPGIPFRPAEKNDSSLPVGCR